VTNSRLASHRLTDRVLASGAPEIDQFAAER
jgi:hypothetical protein